MLRRRLLPLLLPVTLLTAGCSDALDTAGTVRDCAALAADVARSGLSGVPTREEADQAVDRLDERVQDLQDGSVKDAATALRDRLRELQQAVASADTAGAREAAEAARSAARDAAAACGLPADQFLG